MNLFEPIEALENRENNLREKVNQLSPEQKKRYFQEQTKRLKDPDTYASLNWLCLGGFHHLYLGKATLFLIEITLLITGVIGLFWGHHEAIILLIGLLIYELPHLFLSQKIVRQHNEKISNDIYVSITGAMK